MNPRLRILLSSESPALRNGILTILSVLDIMVDMKVRAKSRHAAMTTVTATEAKTRFGPLLETAIRGGSVVITKHDAPKAVLLSIAEFEALGGSWQPDLNALSAEFDSLAARLQAPGRRLKSSRQTVKLRAQGIQVGLRHTTKGLEFCD